MYSKQGKIDGEPAASLVYDLITIFLLEVYRPIDLVTEKTISDVSF